MLAYPRERITEIVKTAQALERPFPSCLVGGALGGEMVELPRHVRAPLVLTPNVVLVREDVLDDLWRGSAVGGGRQVSVQVACMG